MVSSSEKKNKPKLALMEIEHSQESETRIYASNQSLFFTTRGERLNIYSPINYQSYIGLSIENAEHSSPQIKTKVHRANTFASEVNLHSFIQK
jgi:hypothetical protein